MKAWGDAKSNIAEHVFLSASVFMGGLFWDHIVHLAHFIGLNFVADPLAHPYKIGSGQIIVMVLSAIHFARKLNEWRYYGNILPESVKREL